jgi:hypothetical protein
MVINDEILGGLKSAIARGQSLKSSINSLSNSGYSKTEIDDAVKALSEPEPKPVFAPISIAPPEKQKPIFKKLPSMSAPVVQPISMQPIYEAEAPVISQRPIKRVERVIYYGGEETSTERLLIIVLISFLVFLIGVLMLLFIFRKDLISFFSSLSTK